MSWLQYFLPITPLVPSLVKATRSFRLPFMLFAQKIFRRDVIGTPQKSAQRKIISVIAEAWFGFGYPHILDLGEFLYKARYEVKLLYRMIKTQGNETPVAGF